MHSCLSIETISNIVTESVETNSADKVTALEGWELSLNVNGSAWSDSLILSEPETTGIYTFFASSTAYKDGDGNTVSAMTTNIENAKNTENAVKSKHIFYARKKSNLNVVYLCSYDSVEDINDRNEINTSITCNNPKVVLNYNEVNTYDVLASDKVVFKLQADFGKYERGGIYYQIVNENSDFDPDGSWLEVKNDKIVLSDITDVCRLYIKYMDGKGNFVVDKTVGFKPKDSSGKTETEEKESFLETTVPTFEMGKTIYNGYSFNLNLANITKDTKVNYKSSNNKVARVNQNGIITSVHNGSAKITGTITNKTKSYRFIIHVTVTDGNGNKTLYQKPVKSVSCTSDPVLTAYKLIYKGKKTRLKLSNLDKGAKVSYLNSNEEVVSVTKSGVVEGIKKGYSVITISVEQGKQIYFYMVQVRVSDGTIDNSMWDYLQRLMIR